MFGGLSTAAYIIAAILFIFSLAWFSKHETSQIGNNFGIIGMATALISTIVGLRAVYIALVFIAMIIGGIIGIRLARRVKMTEIPELIVILHSLVNLTAILVGINSYLSRSNNVETVLMHIHSVETFLGIFIGAMTFTGSIAAFKKLNSKLLLKSMILPNRYKLNLATCILSFLLMIVFIYTKSSELKILSLLVMIVVALIFGWYLVFAIKGSDMPVVISMLNSYSGWTAAMSGFLLGNDLLIVTGALVGSSGTILSYIMCKGMNRSFISVIFGSYDINNISFQKKEIGQYREINSEDAANILKNSCSVIITPGYGMAVSQAQFLVAETVNKLCSLNIKVRFGIHPVAGRLPGHMNVLLAEAKIPYNIVFELNEINDDFSKTDTVLVVGANDTVNPSAKDDLNSPIAGMPILEVWKAKNVIVFKRSMDTGYSGIHNPLFFKENVYILFGDAKTSINSILKIL